nr:hypothetical protein [Candidatus Baldrarchaeota archaeon]
MKILPINLTKLKEVSFEPKKEPWNEYRLEDDSILRFRTIAVKFFDTGEVDPLSGCPNYIVAHQNILSVISDKRGEPLEPPKNIAEIPDDKKKEINIVETIKEDWNVYIVDEKYMYEMKPYIVAVYRLEGYFDISGYPIYHVRSQNISRIKKLKID